MNGNPDEEEEASQEGSVESVEYVSDSGEMEEETEEEEGGWGAELATFTTRAPN